MILLLTLPSLLLLLRLNDYDEDDDEKEDDDDDYDYDEGWVRGCLLESHPPSVKERERETVILFIKNSLWCGMGRG